MLGARNRSLRAAATATSFAALFATGRAHAEAGVSIAYDSPDELELARRMASELESEGYSVEISTRAERSPCDASGPKLVSVPRNTKAWIRLGTDPTNGERSIATICYLGAQPFLQQAAPSAPSDRPHELALATAEALNGLRSKLPPIESASETPNPPSGEAAPPPERYPPPPSAPSRETFTNDAALGVALVSNLPDLPVALGVTARTTLGITPSFGIVIDAFVPFTAGEVASQELSATVRTSFFRVGPRFATAWRGLELGGVVLAGPALSWATASAAPPRVGTADVALGALLSLGAFLEYPQKSWVFGRAAASVSVLLPGVEVDLGDTRVPPRGYFPIEASLGFGARWGAGR